MKVYSLIPIMLNFSLYFSFPTADIFLSNPSQSPLFFPQNLRLVTQCFPTKSKLCFLEIMDKFGSEAWVLKKKKNCRSNIIKHRARFWNAEVTARKYMIPWMVLQLVKEFVLYQKWCGQDVSRKWRQGGKESRFFLNSLGGPIKWSSEEWILGCNQSK